MSETLFRSGEAFGNFRIPALLQAPDGSLLAACEARTELNDHAQNRVVLRRSEDGGRNWSALQIVADFAPDACNNPTLCRSGGRVLLLFQRYDHTAVVAVENPERFISHLEQNFPPNVHEAAARPGFEGPGVVRTFISYSDDSGRSWSLPRDITRMAKLRASVTCYASGPGHGITLRSGRILVPCNHGPWNDFQVYVMYSDDGGACWHCRAPVPPPPEGRGNEVQAVELPDGSILLNARPHGGPPRRLLARSHDGGESWSALLPAEDLPNPGCHASTVFLPDGRLVCCGPAHTQRRCRGTLFVSRDLGESWHVGPVLEQDFFAYSDLCITSTGTLAVLYECADYSRVGFTLVHPNDLP